MTDRGGNYYDAPLHDAGGLDGDLPPPSLGPTHGPTTPPHEAIAAVGGRVLDPATAVAIQGVVPRSTAYVGQRLLISNAVDFAGALRVLRAVADHFGWSVDPEEEDPRTAGLKFGVRAVRLGIAANQATVPPDAWTLLQQTRAQFGVDAVRGVALEHVLTAWPFGTWHPFDLSRPSEVGLASPMAPFSFPVLGGPQPMAYVGRVPIRAPLETMATRRPVVAILDTGCAGHPWLDDVVISDLMLDGVPIGYASLADDWYGGVDPLAGHGTFIAGLVRQRCPDADILSWRVVPGEGALVESDLIASLAQVAELVRRFRAGEPGGHPIDVLSLSMGYYHETPQEPLFDLTLYEILEDLARHGTLVVCAAGDDGTSRPFFPAAFAPWADDAGPIPVDSDIPPIVSVGALNPNRTDALFSNTGPWVRAYASGTELMSTCPAFEGGLRAVSRTRTFGRMREEVDPDDFRGGFGRWSGTSFAAPVLAADLASSIQGDLELGDDTSSALTRAWSAIEATTGIARRG